MIPETFKRQTSESVRSVYDRLVDIEDAFQLVVVYDAFATGKVTVELGFVLS